MKVKITSEGNGRSWYADHVGKEFYINSVTVHLNRNGSFISYECDLVGRHLDAIAGSITPQYCEVIDWTGWPFGEAHT